MAVSSGGGRVNSDRDLDKRECNGAYKRPRLMLHDANEANHQLDGVLRASCITANPSAINPDEAFESLEVTQLFNLSRDGVIVSGTRVRSKAILIIKRMLYNNSTWIARL